MACYRVTFTFITVIVQWQLPAVLSRYVHSIGTNIALDTLFWRLVKGWICAMSQAVSRWPVTAEARVLSQDSPCGIWCGFYGSGIGFAPSLGVRESLLFQCSVLHSISSVIHHRLYSLSSGHTLHTRDKADTRLPGAGHDKVDRTNSRPQSCICIKWQAST
jgi:hypothetical protein